MKTASWVIRNKATGDVVMETFDKKKVDKLNTAKYEAVPILEYLQSLNRKKNLMKKPTPKQLAARKLFAQRAKAGTLKTATKTKRKSNPASYPNIEKSGFRAGEYVAYADGAWRVRREGKNWIASRVDGARSGEPVRITGKTLSEISGKLDLIGYSDNPKPRSKSAYVNRPSQASKAAPSKRLKARRTVALLAPKKGYWPNPTDSGLFWVKDLKTNTVRGWFRTLKEAKQYAQYLADTENRQFIVGKD